jgi:hypothetical protein
LFPKLDLGFYTHDLIKNLTKYFIFLDFKSLLL